MNVLFFRVCHMGIGIFLGGLLVLQLGLLTSGCSQSGTSTEPILEGPLAGGSSTVFDTTRMAFSHPSPTLTSEERTHFFSGQSFFDQSWVAAPSSTEARDGLGPYFNARSCASCHERDGRGRPPEPGETFVSLLIRLSVSGQNEQGGPNPDPNYGGQLQGFSLPDVTNEGEANVSYSEEEGVFSDGEHYSLARPVYSVSNLGYGDLSLDIMMSPRVAPTMIGLGLLEAVEESHLLEFADEHDSDGDGISGRPNRVWDEENQQLTLGRFGWKANQPTVRQQVAGAFSGDIGISTPLFPSQNIAGGQENEASAVIHGGNPELSDRLLDRVTVYSKELAVPARRNVDNPIIRLGETQFEAMGCAKCHRPSMTANAEKIYPYTDLLLHDMGDDLADNRPDFEATGNEWRTPPLWGIGLVETVNGHTRFLHDGRARNFVEAIMWHGGEGTSSKDNFADASKVNRDAVIAFLESL